MRQSQEPGYPRRRGYVRKGSAIDAALSKQLTAILHHPEFRKLEASWRGLYHLVRNTETSDFLEIRVLNVSREELAADFARGGVEDSALFARVYADEADTPGGEPFAMLVGDYEFSRHPEDVSLLKMVSNVAAGAHAPFISAASPKLLNMDSFTELGQPRDLAKIFMGVEYASWKSFRESEDSRYVALTLPHVLGRLPYGEDFKRVEEFN